MILEPKKIKSVTVSIVSPSICHEVIGPPSFNNTREDSTHGHHQMVNIEIRLIIFFAVCCFRYPCIYPRPLNLQIKGIPLYRFPGPYGRHSCLSSRLFTFISHVKIDLITFPNFHDLLCFPALPDIYHFYLKKFFLIYFY